MRDAKAGTYNGDLTYCPVNAYGECPYCDQRCVCHVDDPMEDCDDWQSFWDSWDEWVYCDDTCDDKEDFAEEEIQWAREHMGYEENQDLLELGFDPYMGDYSYDC